ncbi:pancreatic lipase-related protein 2-like [Diadema antillarum]|uniref:pancreatic lipase-related protein 2-like n=1 Tax=Diadema antillarum TaxID=105358 RepID=UPI003A873C0A
MRFFNNLMTFMTAILSSSDQPNNQRCFGPLGCFTDTLPCHNLNMAWPAEIDTRFFLFTRQNPNKAQEITWRDLTTVEGSNFKAKRYTKFLLHGWIENTEKPAFVEMKDAILAAGDFNVIMVDWRGGSLDIYETSVQNIRVVGREIATLVYKLQRVFYASPARMHAIGHSLGAHAAGYAGSEIAGFGRITGLDPAGPDFLGNLHNDCRLDKTDALFVDVIHTDGAERPALIKGMNGLGVQEELGHQDFYPNGGQYMPGCFVTHCSHYRSIYFFTESISTCRYQPTHVCQSWQMMENPSLRASNCTACDSSTGVCPRMGFWASSRYGTGSYYLQTASSKPFC